VTVGSPHVDDVVTNSLLVSAMLVDSAPAADLAECDVDVSSTTAVVASAIVPADDVVTNSLLVSAILVDRAPAADLAECDVDVSSATAVVASAIVPVDDVV
jgi:chitodextrinase